MPRNLTRREAITTSAVSSGVLLGSSCAPEKVERGADKGPGRSEYWGPGEDLSQRRTPELGKTPIRLGAFLRPQEVAEYRGRLEDIVAWYRGEGYTALIVYGESFQPLTASERKEFTDALKRHDMILSAVTGNRYTNFIHPDESIRREYLKNLASYIELADSLECPAVPTICGTRDPWTPEGATFQELFTREYRYNVHPGNWSLATWKLLVESIKQVLRDTSGMKAAIAMEAQVTTTIDSPLAHRRLMDDVGDPRLGVEFDPVNMITLDNYYRTTALLDECFDLLENPSSPATPRIPISGPIPKRSTFRKSVPDGGCWTGRPTWHA